MRSKGHVYVVAESMYSDRPRIPMNPPHHEGSPLRTSAFSQGGHGTVLYVFGRHCTMVYAPGREYVFMEPGERGGVPLPIKVPASRKPLILFSSPCPRMAWRP